ncbi:hypothetical protein GIB67_004810, partial [Kingdonia uniflora]
AQKHTLLNKTRERDMRALFVRLPSMLISSSLHSLSLCYSQRLPKLVSFSSANPKNGVFFAFSTSTPTPETTRESTIELDPIAGTPHKGGPLKSGLYLVATPIGNLEDITLSYQQDNMFTLSLFPWKPNKMRALRVLRSADVILSEDTRHSGKLLQHYSIKTPLLSYHKFNESQREKTILKRLEQGDIVALISDAGTPGISDPGTVLAKLCVTANIPVVPIPGPSAVVTALSASGLSTEEFTFVGFLPKQSGARRERLLVSANDHATQIFYVPPHKLLQFLEETSLSFGDSRYVTQKIIYSL